MSAEIRTGPTHMYSYIAMVAPKTAPGGKKSLFWSIFRLFGTFRVLVILELGVLTNRL